MELANRSAIVTGGAGGLGSATVRLLAEVGMGVVVFDLDADRAAELADELGDGVASAGGDATQDAPVLDAIAIAQGLGPLSVLVNVAGGATGGGRLVGRENKLHDIDVFSGTLAMNATGTFNVSRHVAAAMAGNEPDASGERGVIVNTASIAGIEGRTGQVAYAAAKGAILGMTLPMARDLAPIGVRVCSIAPGTMGTPLLIQAREFMKDDPADGVVFPKRMGEPSEFAHLVKSIAENGYLNGENIRLDGALRFQP